MLAFALPLLLTLNQASPAPQQLQGADKLIASLGATSRATKDTGLGARMLVAKLKAFGTICESLPPDEAAKEWLALFDETEKMAGSEEAHDWEANASAAMAVLPPPPAWPAIRRLIEAKTAGLTDRRSVMMRLLAELLTLDLKASETSLIALTGLVRKSPNETGQLGDVLSIYIRMAKASGDPSMLDRALERAVEAVEAHVHINEDWSGLVGPVTEAKLTAIYRRLIAADPTVLDSVSDPESRRIAHRLALELAPSLKAPMWSFADSLDTADLYPVFAKRFPAQPIDGDPSSVDQTRSSAKIWYAVSLELAGKHAQAVASAGDLDWLPNPRINWYYGERAQPQKVADAVFRLMTGVAGKFTDKVPWSETLTAGVASGHLETVLNLVRGVLSRRKPADNARGDLDREYIRLLLSADRVDAAVAEIRTSLRSLPKLAPGIGNDEAVSPRLLLYEQLSTVGRLTDREDVRREGEVGWKQTRQRAGLDASAPMDVLVAHGRAREAEEQIVRAISASLRAYANRNGRPMASFGGGGLGWGGPSPYYASNLLSLADLYRRLNRPADVIRLLQDSPGWGVADLAGLYPRIREEADGFPAPILAAWALSRTGEKRRAVEIISPLILKYSEFDRYCEAALDVEGAKAIPLFDEAFRRNPFVARPLIWKAEALHLAHRDREAETAARQAIALDPSDGNAPADKWQEVYAILAEIRSSRGDANGAAKLRQRVGAAKLKEKGDELLRAGLNVRAIAAYQSAAKLWPDSARIQCDLAVELETGGTKGLAAAHYRKTFLLLPDQLGCREATGIDLDRLFKHPEVATIARSEFAARLERNPKEAATLYLSGELASAQGQDREAAKFYLAATKADPKYVLAWACLADTRSTSALSPAVVDSALFALRRLDPDEFVTRLELRPLMDPAVVWKMFHDTRPQPPGLPKRVWRLDAAAKAVAAAPSDVSNPYRRRDSDSDEPDYRHPSAARAVADMPLIGRVVTWIENPGMEG